jgi:hypothetical protein
MISLETIQTNLLSPMVLAFYLGVFAVYVKSDLKLPESFFSGLSIYLLLSLGLKGGASMAETPIELIVWPALGTLFLGVFLPQIAYGLARFRGRFSRTDSAALAAHYGSVSVVTFIASHVFMESIGQKPEGFMTALVTILEVPGIISALLLAERQHRIQTTNMGVRHQGIGKRIGALLVSKSILVLLGGLFIGMVCGNKGIASVKPFFIEPFYGVLVLFMLDMGLVAGARLQDLSKIGLFMLFYAIIIPIINGFLGSVVGLWCGLSVAGASVLAAMAASASYIAAPAAVRIALPTANPAIYLTAALVITFPFNLTIGIPLYYTMVVWLNQFLGAH